MQRNQSRGVKWSCKGIQNKKFKEDYTIYIEVESLFFVIGPTNAIFVYIFICILSIASRER